MAAAPADLGVPAAGQGTQAPRARRAAGPCLLGPLCLGPVFSLGLPNPLGIGLQVRFTEFFGAGFDYQVMPTISPQSASVGWSLLSVEGRLYPLGGSLFVSGGISIQQFFGRGTVNAPDPQNPQRTAPVTLRGSVTIPALKLGAGLMGRDGFVLGMDVALLVRLSGTRLSFEAENGIADIEEIQKAQADIEDAASMVLDSLPFLVQFNIVRIGYLF